MRVDTSGFKFSNNTWECPLTLPCPTTLWLKGEMDFFEHSDNVQSLEILADTINTLIDKASEFASRSEYENDVNEAGGLRLESIYAESWIDIRLWFRLGDCGERMLGVRVVDATPIDVFCDN